MMSRDGLYDLLVEAFDGYLDEVSQDADRTRYDEIFVFVFSIDRVANGWSGDPAVMAEFLEQVPPTIGTPVEALRLSATFIASQTMTTLEAHSMKPIVEALATIRRPSDVAGLPRAFQIFVEKVFASDG